MPRRAATALALLIATLPIGLPAATAATESGKDARGDAPAYIDVTRLTVRNTAARVVFRVEVRDLAKDGQVAVFMYDGSSGAEFRARRRDNGSVAVKAFNADLDDTYKVTCDGIRAKWSLSKDLVKISAPQSCYQVTETPDSWDVGTTARGTRAGIKVDDVDFFTVARD